MRTVLYGLVPLLKLGDEDILSQIHQGPEVGSPVVCVRLVGSYLLDEPSEISVSTLDDNAIGQVGSHVLYVQLSLLVGLPAILDKKILAVFQTKIDRDALPWFPLEHRLVGSHAYRLVDGGENQTVRLVFE